MTIEHYTSLLEKTLSKHKQPPYERENEGLVYIGLPEKIDFIDEKEKREFVYLLCMFVAFDLKTYHLFREFYPHLKREFYIPKFEKDKSRYEPFIYPDVIFNYYDVDIQARDFRNAFKVFCDFTKKLLQHKSLQYDFVEVLRLISVDRDLNRDLFGKAFVYCIKDEMMGQKSYVPYFERVLDVYFFCAVSVDEDRSWSLNSALKHICSSKGIVTFDKNIDKSRDFRFVKIAKQGLFSIDINGIIGEIKIVDTNTAIIPFKYLQSDNDRIHHLEEIIMANELFTRASEIRFPLRELKNKIRGSREESVGYYVYKGLEEQIGCCYAHYYAKLLVKALHNKGYFSKKYYEGYFNYNSIVSGLHEVFIHKETGERIRITAETGI